MALTMHWIPALVVATIWWNSMDVGFHENNLQTKVVDVVYLESHTATKETLEWGVSLLRICIVIGGKDNECLPVMLEEACILAGYNDKEENLEVANTCRAEIDEGTVLLA